MPDLSDNRIEGAISINADDRDITVIGPVDRCRLGFNREYINSCSFKSSSATTLPLGHHPSNLEWYDAIFPSPLFGGILLDVLNFYS